MRQRIRRCTVSRENLKQKVEFYDQTYEKKEASTSVARQTSLQSPQRLSQGPKRRARRTAIL